VGFAGGGITTVSHPGGNGMSDIPIASCEHWRLGCCPFCFDDLTKQLSEKDRLLADPTLGRLVPIDVQAALDAAIQDSEDVDANT
jgi:hypothetical protein